MSTERDRKVEEIKKTITDLATELRDKSDMPLDRVQSIQAEITTKSAEIDDLMLEERAEQTEAKLNDLEAKMALWTRQSASSKASAILAGVPNSGPATKSVGRFNEVNWLGALIARRNGDPDAQEFVKAILGTSSATGTAIIPNNFVASLISALTLTNPYRGVFDVVGGVSGAGVDIPYTITAEAAALLQGAYGSNKDIRDFSFARATATLYQIAQIADVGNQLLQQSNGAAENEARKRLADQIGIAEATFINNGSGSSQPLGFFQAFLAFGDPVAFKTTLSSEPRLATMARGIAAMEARGVRRGNLVYVMNPTDYWETAAEGLGTAYAGGWAVDPAGGAAANPPITSAWGVPLITDPNWPSAQAGTGLLIDKTACTIFLGQEYRVDVSSEAGSRFDQNITGFRAEELFGFNAEPAVRTGRVQKIIGI